MDHAFRELIGRTAEALRNADDGHTGANDFSAFTSSAECMMDRLIDAMFPRHAGKAIMREQALFEAAELLSSLLSMLSYDAKRAAAVTQALIGALPDVYRVLKTDLMAAYIGETRTLDSHVQRLRRKLGWQDRIKTVHKIGYRLDMPEQE